MLFFARSFTLLAALTLAGLGAAPAAAQETGGNFFSRFIPSFGSTPTPTPVVAPKPAVKPSAPEAPSDPTDASPFTSGGGGLINTINGRQSNACDGVVCMFMGGETKGHPPVAPVAATSAPQTTLASARRPVDDRVSPRKEHCTAPANDPWRCYR